MDWSAEDSVFSRFCHITLITFLKVLQLIEGYISTIWNSLESVLRFLKKFRGTFRGGFSVFHIVSFWVKRAQISLQLTYNNATAIWNINCGVESVNGTFKQIIRNSVENSVFPRLCPFSLITFPKILQHMEGYVTTTNVANVAKVAI